MSGHHFKIPRVPDVASGAKITEHRLITVLREENMGPFNDFFEYVS